MRRIQSQAEIDKRKRRNQTIIGVVLIGLLVIAPLGYSLMSKDEDEDSDVSEFGIDFVRQNGIWVASFDGGSFGFQKLPSEVAHIDVNVSLGLGDYVNQPLYFVNPNEGVPEVLNNLGRYILRFQEACLRQGAAESVVGGRWSEELGNESECEGDLPLKDCGSNLIIFEGGNDSLVYQNESCVYIVGDAVGGTDAFLYKILGII